jgi:hypothetical protein
MNGLSRVLHVQFSKEKSGAAQSAAKGDANAGTRLWDNRAVRSQQRFESWAQLILGMASALAVLICLGTADHFCQELARVGSGFRSNAEYGSTRPGNSSNASLSYDQTQAKTNGGAWKRKS